MSEQLKQSVFEIFAQTQQTYEEALKKRESEQSVKKIDRFRISEDGEYEIRVLPLAPILGEDGLPLPKDDQRPGYEFPVQQQFLTIKTPARGKKKAGKVNVPIVRTTQKGVDLPVDLIDEYVKIAKDYGEDIAEQISKNSYSGGLKWSFQHAMYVLDINKNRKGPLLYTCSGAQYHSIEDEKFSIWNQLRKSRPNRPDVCPLCDFTNAYTLLVKRSNNNGKTEYKFSLNALGEADGLNESELNALFNASRICDEIYRYTRYQFEATLVFLQQYDEMLDIDVCEQEDFKTAVEQLRAALSKDDTSHFSLDSAGDGKENKGKSVEVTLDTLWDEQDYANDQGLGKTSDEYQELREKISQYIQDHDLDMRVSHSKTNAQLLEEIEELESNNAQSASANAKEKTVEAPKDESKDEKSASSPSGTRRKRALRPSDEEQFNSDPEPAPEPVQEQENELDAEPEQEYHEAPSRPRRQRPVDDDEPSDEDADGDLEPDNVQEEAPRRRRRLR